MPIHAHAAQPQAIVVFAAASLTDAISEVARSFEAEHQIQIKTSFASSSVLAKQIQRGAPADVFLSADQRWMDHLASKRLIQPSRRKDLLSNRLALIVPKKQSNDSFASLQFDASYPFAAAFSGRLCTGQVDTVPVGVYAKQALKHLTWWQTVKARVVGTQNVRTALAYVERGECAVGIVYETDGLIAKKASVIGLFPTTSHLAIRYPVALTKQASVTAQLFYDYLSTPMASRIFERYGFHVLSATDPVK